MELSAMSTPIILVQPTLAQAPPEPGAADGSSPPILWMGVSGLLLVSAIAAGLAYKTTKDKLGKKLRTEEFKNRELHKKYKRAIDTISKMERNPDLIHSREFNLDYLRMRMEEETFHFGIVNQIKVKVKSKISVALRPSAENRGTGRQVNETFDVEYETGSGANIKKRVLFRIQIKLTKLPTQPTSATISQIIDCIETYLSPAGDNDTWQPALQGRVAYIHWDQTAKPTPLLVLEQSNEGVNVTFRTTRSNAAGAPPSSSRPSSAASAGGQARTRPTTTRPKTSRPSTRPTTTRPTTTRPNRGSSGSSKSRRSSRSTRPS
ncbi:MAG: hypothetical protein JJU32_17215 [Phormidium sp. BM_Day4_Bin.17]|nr:hypothetical protein [Phormidium sp. BM_Day4_Bin.17]UCJ13372.1 MAG: hypothetical protein JWS08_06275 [Phormidium sp. PBR-2020]